jgi:uncharacterized membrane protein YqaE (UPF0057 family)
LDRWALVVVWLLKIGKKFASKLYMKLINNYRISRRTKMDGKDLFALIVTFFIPPAGVAIKEGFKTNFWLNLVLTIFGFYILGLIHALIVVLK